MIDIKIKSSNFQRNGVMGVPFYVAHFESKQLAKDGENCGTDFIATFEMDEYENIIISSCRVVNIFNPVERWRGDVIAYDIQETFKEHFKTHWPELCS